MGIGVAGVVDFDHQSSKLRANPHSRMDLLRPSNATGIGVAGVVDFDHQTSKIRANPHSMVDLLRPRGSHVRDVANPLCYGDWCRGGGRF